jgi:hypothetical protein
MGKSGLSQINARQFLRRAGLANFCLKCGGLSPVEGAENLDFEKALVILLYPVSMAATPLDHAIHPKSSCRVCGRNVCYSDCVVR